MKKFLAGIIPVMIIFLSSTTSSAQLTGVKNIPGDYADLAAAITDLNTQGVGPGGVTLNLEAGNPQTAPSGGYAVTATGTLADPIVIEGNGNTITASASLAAGTLNDAIFKLIGADYVTISGFTMQENPANAITASASNNMTEWGVALLYASTTDGAQNNTIQNNTIDLDRTYPNSFGIYSNSTHSATAISVSATATTISGGNSGLKIFSNTITDVNNGIVVIGPVAAADHNDGLEIGGSVSTANSITNYGTTGSFSSYMNVSATVNGILIRNTKNITVTHNSISSSNGGHINGTIYGIQLPLFSQSSTGTITNNISHNSISVKSGLSSAGINGITLPSNSGTVSSTLNIDNNDFHDFGHTVAATGTIQFIQNTSGNQNISISGNTFTNMTVNTSGNVTFINNANASALVKYVNNNAIVTGFSKTTSGNTVRFILDTGTDFTNAVSNCNNNQISNITVTGITSVRGIDHWNSGSGLIKTISGNTISHISMSSTGTFSGINTDNNNGTSHVSTNTVYNISSGGLLTGISCGVSGSSSANTANFYQNLVHTLLSTGSGAVTGISINGQTASTRNCYRNKIYNLETAGISGTVNGISVGSGTNIHVYNNLVGDLRAPNAASANSSSDAIRGINITSSTANSTINVSYNTVYLNAVSAQPTLFNTCGISHAANASATSATLNMRNNIIVNLSSPNINGLGLTIAFRRTGNNPANYGSVSNNNLFYAGTPDQNRVVFYDGFNTYQTLSQFKFSVYPRETNSVSELPPFLSTTGSDADFLHLNAAVPTQAESGAAPVTGITDDYDTDARNGTSPDIGADEINGISADNTGPVIHFTALTNTLCTSGATLSATISDPSGVNNSAGTLPRHYPPPMIIQRMDGNIWKPPIHPVPIIFPSTSAWSLAELRPVMRSSTSWWRRTWPRPRTSAITVAC